MGKNKSRELFDKPTENFDRQSIADGAADIARGLGLSPRDTLWDYDWIHTDDSGVKWPETGASGAHDAITILAKGGATGLTLKLNDGFLAYQQQYAGVENVIEVTGSRAKAGIFTYPEQSIIAQALATAGKNPQLRDFFNGKVFCAWMPGHDVQETVRALGGTTLVTAAQRETFNSKVRVVTQAQGERYNVAPHVVVQSWDQLEAQFGKLMDKAAQLGLNPAATKYWVKFDNLVAGEGVLPYMPAKTAFGDVKSWIHKVRKNASMPEGSFHPIVMDIDVGHLPEVKRILNNFCVQGIIGPEKAVVTGVTLQKTKDGAYLGGAVPQTANELAQAEEARHWAWPVMRAAQQQGYRGYAGIDVLMAETATDDLRGYVLEMNGRLNSSTPLLSAAQWTGREAGVDNMPATNFLSQLPAMRNFKAFSRAFNAVLYRGARSDHTGVIPTFFEPDAKDRLVGVKMVAVAPDARALAALEKRYDRVVRGLGVK